MASFSQAANGWFEAKINQMTRANFRALEESMKDGEEITKTFIATRGTAKSGKSGRVDTGAMLDAVDSETETNGPDEAIGRFGWLSKKPSYTPYQEVGTQYIEPMFALSDAGEIVIQELAARIEDNVRDA